MTKQKDSVAAVVRGIVMDLKPGEKTMIDPATFGPDMTLQRLQIVVLNQRPEGADFITRQRKAENRLYVHRID